MFAKSRILSLTILRWASRISSSSFLEGFDLPFSRDTMSILKENLIGFPFFWFEDRRSTRDLDLEPPLRSGRDLRRTAGRRLIGSLTHRYTPLELALDRYQSPSFPLLRLPLHLASLAGWGGDGLSLYFCDVKWISTLSLTLPNKIFSSSEQNVPPLK